MSAMSKCILTQHDLTVGKLRGYLDQLEESWTEEDCKYLGDFSLQRINIPYFNANTPCDGYDPASITYDGGMDFIIDKPNED